MSLSPEMLRFIAEYTLSILGKINKTVTDKITTSLTDSNDVIPSSKAVKDEFTRVRGEMPTNTSDLTNDGADGAHQFIVEGDSRLTDARSPTAHTQASSTITDTNTYSNIGNTLQNQASINNAINEKIGALMNLDIIEQVSTRPTASSETMNKIYLVPEEDPESENLFQIFITVYENNAYKWEKIDSASIDLSGKVDKVQGKQLSTEDYTTAEKTKLANIQSEANKTIVDSYVSFNSNNPVSSQGIYSFINEKILHGIYEVNEQYKLRSDWIPYTEGLYNFSSPGNEGNLSKNDYETLIGKSVDYDEIANYIFEYAYASFVSVIMGEIGIFSLQTFENDYRKYLYLKPQNANQTDYHLISLSPPSNYVQKSNTVGLLRNDGTVDTNQYLTEGGSGSGGSSFNCGYVDSNLILHLVCVDGRVTATESVIQSGDTDLITAVITDENNSPLEGIPVDFYINDVKVGSTINTNSSGVATYTYTGTGAGEVTVKVKAGSFVSETYSIIDATFKDIGTQSDHNDNWEFLLNRLSRSFTSDGSASVLTMATGQTWGYAYANNQNYKFDLPLCIEYDLVEIVDSPRIRFKGDTNSQAFMLSNYGTGHYKWIISKSEISLTVDGVNKPLSLSLARENGLGIYWECDSDTDGLTYKNFAVYPI